MDFLIRVGASIVSKILEYTVEPVGHRLGYLFHYKKNVRKLNDELEVLESTKERMIQQVNEARRNGEEIYKDVQDWLNKADHLIAEEDDAAIRRNENRAQLRCSGGKFLNLVLRYKQSKKAKEIASEVSEIKDRSFETVSYRLPLDDSIANKGYKAFEARKSIFNDIMEAIRDPNIRMIGIYGMGGVGKTWLANEVARQGKNEEKLFDKVIMVIISQILNPEKIQCDIAEKLGLKFDETQNSTRANRLRQRLSQETKILIILDDVWKKIDLFDVGIYFNDNQSGCKILMTSRRLPLFNSMDIEVKFPVEALPKNEATELFCEVVGDLGKSPDFRDLLNEVVRECAGLPLVIKTVACALKNKSLNIWENALNELRSSAPDNIEDMSGEVYAWLKKSYDFLESEEAKLLLLLCSMFPEDELISADDLLMYSVGWSFLKHAETMEKARNKIYYLIDLLRDNCLLLPCDEIPFHNGYNLVKVHDVIRDVAKSIASEKGMFNMESITQLEERLLDKECKDSIAISLLGNFAGQLPNMLPCPQLQSFLVLSFKRYSFGRESLPIIPDHFFDETKKLRVLNLLEVCLKSPPLSFSSLIESLQTLRLIGCNLEDTSFIGGLKSLKCLDLSWSRFEKLSKQIGQLTRLQLLALDFCRDLKVIEPTVISSLIHLEELHMKDVNLKWEVERVVYKEIKNLPQLDTLYIRIQKANMMPKDLFTEKLKRYEIILGHGYASMFPQYSRLLNLKLCESKLLYDCGLEKLIKRSEELKLEGCVGVANNFCELDSNAFPLLNVFNFKDNEEVQYIVNSMEPSLPAFPNLEKMELFRLTNLQTICHGELMEDSFSKLKHVSVLFCERLKNLIQFAIVGQLEEIRVCGCMMIEEIFVCRREDGAHLGIHEFPKLRLLELDWLPKLVQFLSCEWETSSCSSPLDYSVLLFNEKVAFPNLEKLYLSSVNSVRKLWPDNLPQVSYTQNLKELSISSCHNLKYLFSIDVAKGFVQLKKLNLGNCKTMEEVLLVKKESGEERRLMETILFPELIEIELRDLSNLKRFCGGETEEPFPNEKVPLKLWLSSEREKGSFKNISFPKLGSLVLKDLPRLKKFCETEYIECPSLFSVVIRNCPELRIFIFNSAMPTTFEEVREGGLVARQALLNETVPSKPCLSSEMSYKTLTQLIITGCNNLEYLFCFATVESLVQVKWLRIESCCIMEEVAVITKDEREKGSFKKISFPKLESLVFRDLPRLKRFCETDCLDCPSLFKLKITECPELTTFISNSTMPITFEDVRKRDLGAQQPLLNEMVAVSNALTHVLSSEKSFKNLVKLKIFKCNNLEYLLPLDMAENLAQLKVLHVCNCYVMQEVVAVTKNAREQGSFKKISFPKLESVYLYNLPKLRRFWEANCIECPSLLRLYIGESPEMSICIANENKESPEMLTTVQEENVNRDMVAQQPLLIEKVAFPNLEELTLVRTVIEIVTEKWPIVPFPKLRCLSLLCSEDRNQGVFSFDIDNYQNLERVTLGGFSCMKKLWQHRELGDADIDNYQNLESVALGGFSCMKRLWQHRELGDAEAYGGRRHTRLDKLHLEILPMLMDAEAYGGRRHTRLDKLHLERLPMLMDLFEDPEDFQRFQNLETLCISSCGRLKTLSTSSSACFPYLQDLRVSECHGMINLLSSSAAKSLVYLTTMTITKCNQMREVIVDKDGEAEGEIVFSRLETLGLHCLPSLQSFYCGNSKIDFPELEKLIVSECPQMENFSRGTVIAHMLDTVISEIRLEADLQWLRLEYAKCVEKVWEGDINSSVRKVWDSDILPAVQGLFPETDDRNVEGDTAHAHQDIHEIN